MLMRNTSKVVPLRALVALEERVTAARGCLQQTSERDPAFERRVKVLVELVRKRDRAFSSEDPFLPPAA